MNDSTQTRVTPIGFDALPPAAWTATIPVRFRHCDPAGIIFTPRYFDILHEAVERFFVERLAIDYYALLERRRTGLGYVHASCAFLQPSRMGDSLGVAVLLGRIGRSSYDLHLPTFRDGREVVRGRLITVVTSLDEGRARPVPEDVRAALDAYRTACGDLLAELGAV